MSRLFRFARASLGALGLALAACGDDASATGDAGASDAGSPDLGAAIDAGPFRFDGGFSARPDASFAYPLDDTLSIFHAQLEATHNSYHLRPESALIDWQYEHAPLDVQLEEQGVRGLELDVHWEPRLGAHRVFHLTRVDARSSCDLFVECLAVVRRWSDAHPDHLPIVIHIEDKDLVPNDARESRLRALEDEVRAVWPEDLIVTPDLVRGTHASLPEALADTGWPTLGATRGHVLFAIDDSGSLRDAYTRGGTGLEGRLFFVDSEPGDAFGAYAIINDASAEDRIDAALAAGFLVRVFGQDGLASALAGERAAFDVALASGAQIVSTDFPAPVPETTFFAEIPGGTPSRCNPMTAPVGCTSEALEARP